MSIIKLNSTSCQNCYKCIRECSIKAIEFKDSKARIIDDECILCGRCVIKCPQNAKYLRDDSGKVDALLAAGKKVVFSIAPSWKAWYRGLDFVTLSASLKKLGALSVEETAIGASETTREYKRLIKEGEMDNIIVTACSSVVLLVEKVYPELIKFLAPVSSPMMAHARLIKKAYGEDTEVVFIGPCYSKKHESEDSSAGGLVSHAVTFKNLDNLLKSKGIEFNEKDKDAVGLVDKISRLYPVPSGILATIGEDNYGKYKKISCDGLDKCIDIFKALSKGEASGVFIEANNCGGGCVGGPVFKEREMSVLSSICEIECKREPQDKNAAKTTEIHESHARTFNNLRVAKRKPTEAEIKEILSMTGKYKKSDELNCGSCGYPTCRAKAEAVFYKKADVHMCVPYFRSRAESMANTMIEHSPNGIIAFDSEEMVIDVNRKAEELFKVSKHDLIGKPIPEFYGDSGFEMSRSSGNPYFDTIQIDDGNTYLEKTIIYIPEQKMYIAFLKNVTKDYIAKAEIEGMHKVTYETAQRVIEKQMRVAQEIASLLGETTAETKMALKKLVSDKS